MPDKSKITNAHRMAELSSLVAALKEQEVLEAIEADLLSGAASPIEILHACQKGMRMVGAMHEEGRYFIAGLIMAGEIMREAIELLKPVLIKAGSGKSSGRVLLGTIEGDIHDIGKNLFRDLLECHGFSVMDLGVDVPPADFIAAEAKFRPCLVAASALVTESFHHLRELVEMFDETVHQSPQRRPIILIGGGQVDERVFRITGADFWAEDALSGIAICQRLARELEEKSE